jgi:hypothetical protein
MTAPHGSTRRREASHLLPLVARRQMLVLVPQLPRFRSLHFCHSSRSLRKLRDLGVSLEENEHDEPMQIDQAVAGSTCIAESSTHLSLRLYTRVGPVILRGLRVLVILEDIPAILSDEIYSRH